MPGISLVISPSLHRQKAIDSFDLLKHRDKFDVKYLIDTININAAFCGYDGYPFHSIDRSDQLIFVEGLVYNLTDDELAKRFSEIAVRFRANDNYDKYIREFMSGADGDFLVLIYLKDANRILFFNDRWGRLPLYYTNSAQLLVLSREVKFIIDWIPSIRLDKFAMAEFLTLEYLLGHKTFFKDIHRLKPASIISATIDNDGIRADIECGILPVSCRFDGGNITRRQAAGQYLELFRQSLETRAEKIENIGLSLTADLSGGYDTRAVFAGLCESGIDFTPCADRLVTGDETETARQLARKYDKDLAVIEAEHPVDDLAGMTRILSITDGLINCLIDTSCFYDDLERENKITGSFANFKGYGGEFIRRVYMPKRGYATLAEAIIDDGFNHYMNVGEACALLNLERTAFRDSLESEISGFDENDPVAQARHLFFEYNNTTVNSGEDRNRLFNWTVAPMWGNQLFSFATGQIPPKYIDYDFFALFLQMLSPKALEIPIYGSGVKFSSPVSRLFFRNRMRLKRTMRDNRYFFKAGQFLRSKVKGRPYIEDENARIGSEIEKILNISETVRFHFDGKMIFEYISGRPNRLHLYQLLTLILYMNEIERKYGNKIVL